ncbi:hypothetical protein LMIY3S_00701 [Labrys miyagiensis]
MNAPLAIAATGEILRYIIEDTLRETAQPLGFTPPPVTIGPPPKSGMEEPSVNLFLCQAVPNASLRNAPGFQRGSLGNRPGEPPLLLDLSYLVSGHGSGVGRDIGLGAAIEALQETPSPPAPLIRTALAGFSGHPDPMYRALSAENLIAGFESLTIKSQPLGIDSTAGLWIAARAPFCPSAFYVVTLAFQDIDAQAGPGAPVVPTPSPP